MDNPTDEQFAEMVDAQCSPAAKRIAELERENASKDAYIARLLKAGDAMADVTTERRRLLWREAVLSGPSNNKASNSGSVTVDNLIA